MPARDDAHTIHVACRCRRRYSAINIPFKTNGGSGDDDNDDDDDGGDVSCHMAYALV